MIYLDNSATTKPSEEVLQSYVKVSSTFFGNASSIHGIGMEAERLLRKSREQAATLVGVEANEIVFTSGGTESNNIAIKGVALKYQNRGKHIITSSVEHPSVIEACQGLKGLGFEVTYLSVDESGRINLEELQHAIRTDTILVSIMHVNNEVGTVQPIEDIGNIVKAYPKLFFHVDAVQGYGKIPLDLKKSHIDLYSISGHKIHGLKGTGLLFVRNGIRLFPLSHGGGQERNLRSGTENLPGIVALVKAMRLAKEKQQNNIAILKSNQEKLIRFLEKQKHVVINTPKQGRVPHIVHFSIPGLKPEVVIHALEEEDIYISTKSACSSKSTDESAVLMQCGKNQEVTTSGLRVSMSYDTTIEDINYFCEKLAIVIEKLKKVMG